MNKILVAVFDSEAKACQGLSTPKDFNKEGDINSDLARNGRARHHA